jgi:hypothetical protein
LKPGPAQPVKNYRAGPIARPIFTALIIMSRIYVRISIKRSKLIRDVAILFERV